MLEIAEIGPHSVFLRNDPHPFETPNLIQVIYQFSLFSFQVAATHILPWRKPVD